MATTLTLVGRKENLVSDALSGITVDSSILLTEKIAALHRVHDDVDLRIEQLEEQMRIMEGGEPPPENGGAERHRYSKRNKHE